MNKVKLPRKRKKAFLKRFTRGEYLVCRVIGEVLEDSSKNAHKFPKGLNRQQKIASYF